MKQELRLRHRAPAEPATALFVRGDETSGLLAACARLGLDPAGRVYRLAGGLLLKLDAPLTHPEPGTIRLRALADNLLVPADADLVPTLLDDEAEGLTRARGLVFLPWGDVLSFDHAAALEPGSLLAGNRLPQQDWHAFREGRKLARRIEEIVLEYPDESADAVLSAGGDPIGTEPLEPERPGAALRWAGEARRSAGEALVWLGRKLGFPRLADLGAAWASRARALGPRLTDAVLGRQAAAIRALLGEFRDGKTEQALRHALPLTESGGPRGAQVEVGDRLPSQDLVYSLGSLLGPSGRKPGSLWVGGHDLFGELTREYRKAAESAQRQGDYRRAALIYGKLLRDYRMAAHTLLRGGLHHDAAILLLNRLDDPRGAALAFEAAGDYDRAVRLYRRVGEHEPAGDLLRRMGEDEAALVEYRLAADQLVASGAGHLAAGRLLATKAGRTDLALEQYLAGWGRRPQGNAVPCLMEALALLAGLAASTGRVLSCLDEADAYLSAYGSPSDISLFYNFVAQLARREEAATIRDELEDRALLALAASLRTQAQAGAAAGRLVSDVLGRVGVWPAGLTRDAEFALKAAIGALPRPARHVARGQPLRRFRIGVGTVTAVCFAQASDEVFVGFEGGEVFCFHAERSEVVRVASYELPVTSLAASPDGRSVVILRSGGHQLGVVGSYARAADGSYRLLLGSPVDGLTDPWLTPVMEGVDKELVGLWDGDELYVMTVASLTSWGSMTLPRPDACPPAAFLIPRGDDDAEHEFNVLVHDGREWCLAEATGRSRHATGLVWRPSLPAENTLRSIPISSLQADPEHLELAGLGGFGTLHWAALRAEEGRLDLVASNSAAREGGYLAVALARSGLVAAVTDAHVEWLRCGADKFTLAYRSEASVPSAVACFYTRTTGELIIICADGFVGRVPLPA
jgi:tetratricopeptide (TPR) repeat protein